MFSVAEKQKIAEEIEKLLLSFNHPEMPKAKPNFKLHIDGAESWSWADIEPNWKYGENNPPGVNPWNEVAREKLNNLQTESQITVLDQLEPSLIIRTDEKEAMRFEPNGDIYIRGELVENNKEVLKRFKVLLNV